MKKIYFIIPFTAYSLLANAQENKQDTTKVNEVIITENRFQIPFNKRIKNIQVIQKDEIEKLPIKSIHELLGYAAGVDIRQRGPFGGQADVNIDGSSFDQSAILLNGAKIGDPQTGHHSLNLPIPLGAIERIEILKGPMARIYGVNALAGAINIVTDLNQASSIQAHVVSGSSFKEKEDGDGSGKYAGVSGQVTSYISGENLKNLIGVGYTNSTGQRYNSEQKDLKLYYQGKYSLDKSNVLEWTGSYIDNHFGANGFYAAPGDKESYEIVKTSFFSLASSHRISDNFILKARLTNRNNKDDYRYFRHDLTKARSQHTNNALSAELNSVWYTSIGDLGIGLELRDEDIVSTNMGSHTRENLGSYLEYKTDLGTQVSVNVGAYLNYNTQYGLEIFPGIDLGYEFLPNWRLSVNVGKSQRIPTFTDLYLNQRPGNIGNPDLKSEYAIQYEGALRGEIGTMQIQANYFYRQIDDFIDWIRTVTNVPYQPANFGDNRVKGVGIMLRHKLKIGNQQQFNYDLSYNYLKPTVMEYQGNYTSKYVVENLKHQFISKLNYSFAKVYLTVSNRYIQRELLDGYLLSDVRFSSRFTNFNIYVDATNILNKTYKEVAAVPMPGRWYNLGVRFKI